MDYQDRRMHAIFLATPYTAIVYPLNDQKDDKPLDIPSLQAIFAYIECYPVSYATAVIDTSRSILGFVTEKLKMAVIYVSFKTKDDLDSLLLDCQRLEIDYELGLKTVSESKFDFNSSVKGGPNQYGYDCSYDGVIGFGPVEYVNPPMEVEKQKSHPKMILKILREKNCDHPLPTYATSLSSGFDLHACLTNEICLSPGCTMLIPSGIKLAIPVGYEVQIRSRSGLTFKNGIIVANSPATIDADFSGKLGILLHNQSNMSFMITPGMKIAQAVLCPVVQAQFQVIDEEVFKQHFIDSNRIGGFGSTGI